MPPRKNDIDSLPLPQFRRLGVLYCRRIAHLITDKRLTKALRKLELSQGPPVDERMCRDAYNAASSTYSDIHRQEGYTVQAAVACTILSACSSVPTTGLRGNFHGALRLGESLALDKIVEIEHGFFREIGEEVG